MLAILAKPLSRVKSVVPWSKAIAAIKTSVVVVTPETLQNLRDDHSSERNGFCVGDHGATWDLTSARDASQSRKPLISKLSTKKLYEMDSPGACSLPIKLVSATGPCTSSARATAANKNSAASATRCLLFMVSVPLVRARCACFREVVRMRLLCLPFSPIVGFIGNSLQSRASSWQSRADHLSLPCRRLLILLGCYRFVAPFSEERICPGHPALRSSAVPTPI